MANPHVWPHLHFYPEDTGKSVSEYWHAKHWHESANPDLVTPLAVINGRSFFVFEPCLLADARAVIPYRWFVHGNSIMAHAWPLCATQLNNGTGWVVEEFETVFVSQDELLVPFGLWATSDLAGGLPDATCIIGMLLYDFYLIMYNLPLKVPCWNQMATFSLGCGLIQRLGTDGVLLLVGHVWFLFHSGCTVTTSRETSRRSGTSTTHSYFQQLVSLAHCLSKSIMSTSCAHLILHLH